MINKIVFGSIGLFSVTFILRNVLGDFFSGLLVGLAVGFVLCLLVVQFTTGMVAKHPGLKTAAKEKARTAGAIERQQHKDQVKREEQLRRAAEQQQLAPPPDNWGASQF